MEVKAKSIDLNKVQELAEESFRKVFMTAPGKENYERSKRGCEKSPMKKNAFR